MMILAKRPWLAGVRQLTQNRRHSLINYFCSEVIVHLSEQLYDAVRVVKITGRVDHDNAEEFKIALQPHLDATREGGALILDFSNVTYISSAGFRVLLMGQRHATQHKFALAVSCAQPVVTEIFAISKFDKIIACHGSVRDAVAAHAPASLSALPA